MQDVIKVLGAHTPRGHAHALTPCIPEEEKGSPVNSGLVLTSRQRQVQSSTAPKSKLNTARVCHVTTYLFYDW